ncbi:hypothetical protein [Cohnella fermenti]|uniref:Uncharacterized protein n=1 Tax=Cohnella fermenti TaxID=2565925 RepID=A0A4S4BFW9_9BACL|nr:hypothetical protein [Cohnella fermenti]THF73270.1 hypothetical protein E6C55_30070 [Cohnella fermenti]
MGAAGLLKKGNTADTAVKEDYKLELSNYQWATLRAGVKALIDKGTIKDTAWLDKIGNKTLTTSELAWLTFAVK